MTERFLDDRVMLHCGDCREVLATLPENSFDACVTDPPYHLVSIINRFGDPDAKPALSAAERRWAKTGGADRKPGTDQFGRLSKGFMGKVWDGGDIAFDPETWRTVLRVLKPGAHAAVFTIPKHIGLVQVAMLEAGFEFRDVVVWAFGSGFPKSHDVSKGIDAKVLYGGSNTRRLKLANEARPGEGRYRASTQNNGIVSDDARGGRIIKDEPATDAAREWEGWGTALKPAVELIILARKPLSEGTVAANVLKWETGAINIDGCRVHADDANGGEYTVTRLKPGATLNKTGGNWRPEDGGVEYHGKMKPGRWPANLIHDGSAEVVAAFPSEAGAFAPVRGTEPSECHSGVYSGPRGRVAAVHHDDSGSAARFFYTAKADADDRLGSRHPTVKPLDLMQYLVRLITPKGGMCLDPFAGTGTAGEAAWREGMSAMLIEREDEYCADIRRRMALALSGPDERARESIKAKNLPRDDGPLFDWPVDGGENS